MDIAIAIDIVMGIAIAIAIANLFYGGIGIAIGIH